MRCKLFVCVLMCKCVCVFFLVVVVLLIPVMCLFSIHIQEFIFGICFHIERTYGVCVFDLI